MLEKEKQTLEMIIEEYKTLREELLTVHSRQQYNVIQGLVVIGAITAFIASNWNSTFNFLVFFSLICLIPLAISTIILTATATFARGRQICYYLARLEIKVSKIIQGEQSTANEQINPLEFMNWYLIDNKKEGRKLLRFDLAGIVVFFLLILFSSVFLSIVYAVSCKTIQNVLAFTLPYLTVDAVILAGFITIIIRTFKYISSNAEVALKNFKERKLT